MALNGYWKNTGKSLENKEKNNQEELTRPLYVVLFSTRFHNLQHFAFVFEVASVDNSGTTMSNSRQGEYRDTFYLLCPYCGAHIQLPDDEMSDPFKVTECLECEQVFDYDIDEIKTKKGTPNVE